ncbi:heavy-metal-associated domain-containing protein [Streptacidiphilus monticola]|uniref:Heavy-metal-associated domain-containing protein n=1 Tax=Streptacidiphilus monticola TaxID=2161674 RepID=A0ABW1FUW2_9ACTN
MSCCSTTGTCTTSAGVTTLTVGAETAYRVSGMTCGHCEQAVTAEVSALEGVTAVRADAATGTVLVTATREIDEAALRAAVDEAGYELVGRI